MDTARFASLLALALSLLALLLALSGCAPSRDDFLAECMKVANQEIMSGYYQPGGRGFPQRDLAHRAALSVCQDDRFNDDRRERTRRLAPIVGIVLNAGSAAIVQTHPRVLTYP